MAIPIFFTENQYEPGVIKVMLTDKPFEAELEVYEVNNPYQPGVLKAFITDNQYLPGVLKVELVTGHNY